MIHIERHREIDASAEAVWSVVGKYMDVKEFAPFIVEVQALTDGEDGVGSIRKNIFKNGYYFVEEVTEWNPGVGYSIKVTEMPGMPLAAATSDIFITPLGGRSKVTWTFDYKPKYGPFGWIMGQTMIRMMMGKGIDGNLKALAEKVEAEQGD